MEPLLSGHDRQKVEVFCYAEITRSDSVTTRLQRLADHWRVTVGLSDQQLAERIRNDGIDILVDAFARYLTKAIEGRGQPLGQKHALPTQELARFNLLSPQALRDPCRR